LLVNAFFQFLINQQRVLRLQQKGFARKKYSKRISYLFLSVLIGIYISPSNGNLTLSMLLVRKYVK
jgi:hypothetical protein